MKEILYTYKNQVYANITNICDCNCQFCIRSHQDGVGEADSLWLKGDPTLEEIKDFVDGYYIITPFNRTGLIKRIIDK